MYGWPYHRWLINLDSSDKLILKRKTEDGAFGQLFHYLFATDRNYARFHNRHHRLFLIQYEWSGKIDYEIVEPDSVSMDLSTEKSVKRLLVDGSRVSISSLVKGLVPSWGRRWLKTIAVRGRNRKSLQGVKGIIVCPVCKGHLQWHDISISCQSCGREYPIRNGIPFLLPE